MMQKIQQRANSLVEEGEKVLSTRRSPPPNVFADDFVDSNLFYTWKASVLSFLQTVFGEKSSHYRLFFEECKVARLNDATQGLGVMKAVKTDIEGGYLVNLTYLAAADVFTDLIDMAEYLLTQKYKDPAASLSGAVLEDGLRKIANSNNIIIGSNEKIGTLSQLLLTHNVINKLVFKKIIVWADIRNNADHGMFDLYKDEDVREMIKGIQDFLITYLTS